MPFVVGNSRLLNPLTFNEYRARRKCIFNKMENKARI